MHRTVLFTYLWNPSIGTYAYTLHREYVLATHVRLFVHSLAHLIESWLTIVKHFESQTTNISYLDFGLIPAVVSCLTNAIALPPIALESCSMAQTDQLVFHSEIWTNFFGWGWRIFCEWHHKWNSFWVILAHVAWFRAQLLDQSISLKFSLETRLATPFELLNSSLSLLALELHARKATCGPVVLAWEFSKPARPDPKVLRTAAITMDETILYIPEH